MIPSHPGQPASRQQWPSSTTSRGQVPTITGIDIAELSIGTHVIREPGEQDVSSADGAPIRRDGFDP